VEPLYGIDLKHSHFGATCRGALGINFGEQFLDVFSNNVGSSFREPFYRITAALGNYCGIKLIT
jgi:hypothetical protein